MLNWLHFFELNRGFSQSWVSHIIDILVVFIVVYEILKLVRDTRAVQMAAGIAVIILLYTASRLFHFEMMYFLMRNAAVYAWFGVIVLFQSEIRAALTHFGKSLRSLLSIHQRREKKPLDSFDEIILAATTFSAQKVGALIVFERSVGLQNYINRGVRMDALLSYDLLINIFNTSAPLHDGAVVIRNKRLAAASCFLPLTLNPRLSKELGTRHRAAIGITEESDAFVIVVSEETGVISTVEQGKITRNLDSRKLRSLLSQAMDLTHLPSLQATYRRRAFASDVSISPDQSITDLSETPPFGTPMITQSILSQASSTKRFREMGKLNMDVFLRLLIFVVDKGKMFLRSTFLKNGKLKLVSGLVTLSLWMFIHTQQKIVSYTISGVQVSYSELPANLMISNLEDIERVTLKVKGPSDIVSRMSPENFHIDVKLKERTPGSFVVMLSQTDREAVFEKPYDVEILDVMPNQLLVNLEYVVERQVSVTPVFRGNLPDNYQIANIQTIPSFVLVRGPEALVQKMQNVSTETIWLGNRKTAFVERCRVSINNPKIEVLDPKDQQIYVSIDIQPLRS